MKAFRLILLCAVTALMGCFSLGREEPTLHHYVLGVNRSPAPDAQAERLAGLAIGLRQLKPAEYLQTPLIVVRQGPHEIRFSEFNRWGENLGVGVNRAVAGYLTDQAAFDYVDVVPWPPRTPHDFLIQIHLLRFEGLAPANPAMTDGEAYLLATWEIMSPDGSTVLARGTTDYREGGWAVGDYGALVTMLDMGLRELSEDLISSIESLMSS